jgi:hypothetical protein
MIPEFDDRGYLPTGAHPAALDEIEKRFGTESELRRVQMQSIRWLVDLARRAGIERIILNGSFVTDVYEPNDVDCALLVGHGFPKDASAVEELDDGLPFLDIAILEPDDFSKLVDDFFARDRYFAAKGMVEIIEWRN